MVNFQYFSVGDATKTVAFGPGVLSGLAPGKTAVFMIQARDKVMVSNDCEKLGYPSSPARTREIFGGIPEACKGLDIIRGLYPSSSFKAPDGVNNEDAAPEQYIPTVPKLLLLRLGEFEPDV